MLSGCKKPETAGPSLADALTVVQGNLQSVQAGMALPMPLVLRVTDKSGTGLANLPVTFTIGGGGGSVTPATALSDARGEVTAKWTVGPSSAAQTLIATTNGPSPLKLEAVAILPSGIIVAQGNNQTAIVKAALLNAIIVRVIGTGNVPLVGIPVSFQVVGGGGAMSPSTVLTNAFGEASTKWTLGAQAGTNTASVTASTLPPVTLTATATP